MNKIFCPNCGAALEVPTDSTQHRCPHCGHEFAYNAGGQPTGSPTPPPLTPALPATPPVPPPMPPQQPRKSGSHAAVAAIIAIAVILLLAAAAFAGYHYAARQNDAAIATDTIVTTPTAADATTDPAPRYSDEAVVSPELDEAVMQRELTESDLNGLSQWQLKLLRNEVFARHGYIFQSADMQQVFSQYSWYTPAYSDVTSMLSHTEQYNVTLIKRHEDM